LLGGTVSVERQKAFVEAQHTALVLGD